MNFKYFYFCYLGIIFLNLTFFYFPLTQHVWNIVDIQVFKTLNSLLSLHPFVQFFWAFLNHRAADFIEDVILLLFLIGAIRLAPSNEKISRYTQSIFCILSMTLAMLFLNCGIIKRQIHFPRNSPSLVISPCIHLSEQITTLKIKDRSKSSFPGDHANFLLLFCFFYGSVVGGPLNKYLYMYASLRSLPRLIVGAHWFSDILVGSLSMTLFCASLLLYTPFRIWALKWIEKNLKKRQIVDHEKKARPLS